MRNQAVIASMLMLTTVAASAASVPPASAITSQNVAIGFRIYVDGKVVAAPMATVAIGKPATITRDGQWKIELVAAANATPGIRVDAKLSAHQAQGWVETVALRSTLKDAVVAAGEGRSSGVAYRLEMALDRGEGPNGSTQG